MNPPNPNEELRVRDLRNLVFGIPVSDAEWKQCGPNWMKPESTKWLEEQVKLEAEKKTGLKMK